MDVLASLWFGGAAYLYSQLRGESMEALMQKAATFQDQPPLLQINVAAVAVLSVLIVIKV